jgi:LruC domain-containing protein
MKTAKYVIVAMGLLLLLSSCFMSSPWLAGGEGDSVYLPPDVIKDTTRSGSEPFQFETLLPVDLNLEIDFYDLNTVGLDKAAPEEISAIAGQAVVVITDSKGNLVYEGAVQADGSLDDQMVLPAAPEDMTLTVKAYGFQDRSVKINDLVKYSKIDRKMGLMSEGLSAKELGDPEEWDRDGDLIPNIYDAFPDDPDYAFALRYPPNEDEYLTVAYEDLYLEKDAGDADYNDFLVKYVIYENIGYQVTKKNMLMNATVEATAEVKIAGYDHLFGIAFGCYLDSDETLDGEFTLTYFDSDGNEQTINQNTYDLSKLLVAVTESDESPFNYKAVIPLFGSTEAATSGPTKKKAVITVTFEDGIERDKVQLAPYDPFLYVWNTSYDIHLVGEQALPSIPELPWIDSIEGPNSGDAMGSYTFMDGAGYPWALLVPVDWEHPPETVHIEEVYPFFENWRMSDGASDTNWYLRKMDPGNEPPGAPVLSADALTFDSTDSALQEEKLDITLGTDADEPVSLHWTDLPTYVKIVDNTEGSESHKVTVELAKILDVPEEFNIYFWCEDAKGARSEFTPLNLTFEEPAAEPVVHAAGYYEGINDVAVYWKDDPSGITDLSGTTAGRGNSVFVVGNTVYVAGYINDGSNDVAGYWKDDGTSVSWNPVHPTSNARANAVYVDGGTVYVAGYYHNGTNNAAAYWTDDGVSVTPNPLYDSVNAGEKAEATDILVSSGVVYVSGFYHSGTKDVACYWQGSTKFDVESVENSRAYAIALSGSTVYTAGSYFVSGVGYTSCYWQGTATRQDLNSSNSRAWDIALDGTDVYVAGYYTVVPGKYAACYWLNDGTGLVDLYNNTSYTAEALGIFLYGGEVYACGYYNEGTQLACYWKNTGKVDLYSGARSLASSLFLSN